MSNPHDRIHKAHDSMFVGLCAAAISGGIMGFALGFLAGLWW